MFQFKCCNLLLKIAHDYDCNDNYRGDDDNYDDVDDDDNDNDGVTTTTFLSSNVATTIWNFKV